MSSNDDKRLSPLTTHWHNRSLSSLASATTFHSAHAQMELSPLSTPYAQSALSMPTPLPPSPPPQPVISSPSPTSTIAPSSPKRAPSSPKIKSEKMSRHDSGFAFSSPSPPPSQPSSRRTSSSSTRPKRTSTTSTSTRPSQKRSSRSSQTTARTSLSSQSQRPAIRTRHTAPSSQPRPQTPHTHQFFHFPSLPPPQTPQKDPPPPPPATIQYWTSDTTRRMEYAAIDAASRGLRGFFIRLVPDCILPPDSRRTRFHCESGDDDDGGSVRRYRLSLGEEMPREEEKGVRQRGLLRRWTSLGFGRGN